MNLHLLQRNLERVDVFEVRPTARGLCRIRAYPTFFRLELPTTLAAPPPALCFFLPWYELHLCPRCALPKIFSAVREGFPVQKIERGQADDHYNDAKAVLTAFTAFMATRGFFGGCCPARLFVVGTDIAGAIFGPN